MFFKRKTEKSNNSATEGTDLYEFTFADSLMECFETSSSLIIRHMSEIYQYDYEDEDVVYIEIEMRYNLIM